MSLKTIVQNMVTASEPEVNIAKVIKHYNQINKSPLKQVEEVTESETIEIPECEGENMEWSEQEQKCIPKEVAQRATGSTFITDEKTGKARIIPKRTEPGRGEVVQTSDELEEWLSNMPENVTQTEIDDERDRLGLAPDNRLQSALKREKEQQVGGQLQEVVVTGKKPDTDTSKRFQRIKNFFKDYKLSGTSQEDINKAHYDAMKVLSSDEEEAFFTNFNNALDRAYAKEIKDYQANLSNQLGIPNLKNEILSTNRNLIKNERNRLLKNAGVGHFIGDKFYASGSGPVWDARLNKITEQLAEFQKNLLEKEISNNPEYKEKYDQFKGGMQEFKNKLWQDSSKKSTTFQEVSKQLNQGIQKNITQKLIEEQKKQDKEHREAFAKLTATQSPVMGILNKLAPEFTQGAIVPNVAAISSFITRSGAGLVDMVENFGINPVLAIIEAPYTGESVADAYNRISRENKIDLKTVYEAADKLDELKLKYYNSDGQQMGITDLIGEGRYGDAGALAVNEAIGSSPAIFASIAMPYLGPALLGGSVAGQEMAQTLDDPKYKDKNIFNIAGASLLKGGIEYGMERLAGNFFRSVNNLKKSGVGEKAIKEYTDGFLKTAGKKLAGAVGGGIQVEGFTEGFTTLGQELVDLAVLGDEKELTEVLKRTADSAIIGAVSGAGAGGGISSSQLGKTYDNIKKVQAYKHVAPTNVTIDLGNIDKEIYGLESKDKLNNADKQRLEVLKLKKKNREDNLVNTLDKMTPNQFDNYVRREDKIKETHKKINELSNIVNDKNQDGESVAKAQAQIEQLNGELENLLETNASIFNQGRDPVSGKIVDTRVEAFDKEGKIVYDKTVDKIISDNLNKKIDLSKITDKYKKVEKQQKNVKGVLPNIEFDLASNDIAQEKGLDKNQTALYEEGKNGKVKVTINEDLIGLTEAGGDVVAHETLTYLMSRDLNINDQKIQPLVDSFKDYLRENQPYLYKKIQTRIGDHYSTPKTVVAKGKVKDNNNEIEISEAIKINPDVVIGEEIKVTDPGTQHEWFTIFSDLAGKNKIIKNESLFNKILKPLNNWLKGYSKTAKINDGEAAFDFITDFSKNINKAGKFTDVKITSDIIETTPQEIGTKAASVSDLDSLLENYDGNATSMVQDTYLTKPDGTDAINNIQESILGREIAPIVESITKRLYDPIAPDAKRGVSRKEYKDALVSKAGELIGVEYKKDKGSLDKYISTTLNQRANRIAKELGIESAPEKGGLGIKEDITQAKTIAVEDKSADTIIKKSLLKSLPLTKDTKDKIGNYIEVGLQKAGNDLSTKIKPGKAFTNAGIKTINNALDSTIKLKAGPEIKAEVLKLSKNQNNFDKYIKKNWEDVFNSYLDNINLNKLNNPKSLPTKRLLQDYKDNGFTQEDVLNYFNDPSIRSNTRSDRKNKALFNAIIRNISENAKIDFWENNKKAKQEFIKNFGIASKSDIDPEIQKYLDNNKNAPQTFKYSGQGALGKLLGKKAINAGAMAVYNDKGALDIKASKKYIDKFIPQLESIFSISPLIGNSPRGKNGKLKIETQYRKSGSRLFGPIGSKSYRAANPETEAGYQELNNYFNKKRAESIERLSKANLPKFIKDSPAENYDPNFDFNDVAKNFKEFEKLRNSGKLDKINLANLDMWKQNSQALYDAMDTNPDLVPVVAWFLNNDSYGGKGAWWRNGAEMIGMSFNTKPGMVWEHAMQANNAAVFFIESAMAGVPFNIVHDGIQKNFKVIGLNKNDDPGKHFKDNMAMPGETWNVYTDSWTNRYVNPLSAVDLSTIGTGDGNTLADLYPTNKVVAASKSDLDQSFNAMLEKSKGVKAKAEYSEARAIKLGEKKGFQAFVPYSAEDYLGLVYPTLGKGEQGNKDLQWYKDNIMDPYNNGIQEFEVAKQGSITAWNEIKKKIKNTPANLKKEAIRGFNNEDAIRIYLWNKQDISPDNLAKKDISEITKYVNSKPELKKFANEIQMLNSVGYPAPNNNWLAGTITTDLVNHVNTVTRSEFLQPWQEAVDVVYSKTNKNKLRATFGNNYVESLEDALYRMKTGRNRPAGTNRITNTWLNWLNDSVGTVMFLNQRSALLQTISSVNYLNWTDNNPAQAAKAFANQKQFWNDFSYLFNSDFLKQRRSGLKTDVNADEIAQSAATSPNKARAAASWLLKKGFLPTQMADSFAISIGGASFYRNRVNKYKKEGLNQKEAEEKAFLDFRNTTTESQQSADPSRISMQQASPLGRVILAFANTPIQYTRLTKRAIQDLQNGRGDWKTNVSKIVYYGAVQNIIFTGLQQALFGMLFDDDEPVGEKEAQFKQDRKEGSILKLINSSADTILRGSGVGGAFIAMIKNLALEAKRQSEKSRPDYERVADKLFSFSPVIDSKFRKLQSAGRTFTYKQELKKIQERGVAVDNPALMAAAQTLSAFANIPLDRAIKKINNLKTMTEEETKLWQQIALFMGYGEWELGIQARKVDEERAKVKKEKAEAKKFKKLQKNIDKGTKKKSPFKSEQGVVLGRANNDGTIEVASGLSPKKKAQVIRHEKLHQKEIKSGKLNYDDGFVYYGKKKFERKNGQIAHAGKWKQEGDHSLPWEKFAHKHD